MTFWANHKSISAVVSVPIHDEISQSAHAAGLTRAKWTEQALTEKLEREKQKEPA
jgi:hypothetical protein